MDFFAKHACISLNNTLRMCGFHFWRENPTKAIKTITGKQTNEQTNKQKEQSKTQISTNNNNNKISIKGKTHIFFKNGNLLPCTNYAFDFHSHIF